MNIFEAIHFFELKHSTSAILFFVYVRAQVLEQQSEILFAIYDIYEQQLRKYKIIKAIWYNLKLEVQLLIHIHGELSLSLDELEN